MEELIELRYQILQKISQQRQRIGGRRLPRIREPIRECTHWDYFLEEMKWLATDFIEDRKHKQSLAYIITTEIRQSKIRDDKKEAKKELKCREQAKKLSEMVLKYFFSVDDGYRFNEKEQPTTEKIWRVVDVVKSPPAVNIILENSKNKKIPKIDTTKTIHKYTLSMIHNFGYSPIEKIDDFREPSTPDTNTVDNDIEALENLANFQLFYDVDPTEKDLNSQLEELHLEDLDVYRPLTVDNIEFRDVTYEEALFEEELFELVPDSEEYMLWENTKKCLEGKDMEMYHVSEINGICKRDWKIFEDMILEQSVCEFGGNWEFISDLLSTNPLCTFNYVTPEECFNRWVCLQKRKGRAITQNFRPVQVFQNEYPPVQYIPSSFSNSKRKHARLVVTPKLYPDILQDTPHNVFGFYLKHNTRPEANLYFSNYKNIHSRFYAESPAQVFNGALRNHTGGSKEKVQELIDKEEENNLTVLDLLEVTKAENDGAANSGPANGKGTKSSGGQAVVKKTKAP